MNLFSRLSVRLRKGCSVGLFVNRVYQFAEFDDVVMPWAFGGTHLFGKGFRNRLFVGGLPLDTTTQELAEYFSFFWFSY